MPVAPTPYRLSDAQNALAARYWPGVRVKLGRWAKDHPRHAEDIFEAGNEALCRAAYTYRDARTTDPDFDPACPCSPPPVSPRAGRYIHWKVDRALWTWWRGRCRRRDCVSLGTLDRSSLSDHGASERRMMAGIEARDILGLDSLPSRDRTILALRFLEGCTFPEIGAKLGIAPSAARQAAYRALAALRGMPAA